MLKSRLLKKALIIGVALFLALPFCASADAFPHFGPQPASDKYFYFGDATYPATTPSGINLSVDDTSVSYQSTKATATLDYQLIDLRNISTFKVLANGIVVDHFEPARTEDNTEWRSYYYLDINITDQYIGSYVYFQIVAVNLEGYDKFVVAWSNVTPTYSFKAFPVTDKDTHGLIDQSNSLLQSILDKLNDLKASFKASIEKIYTVTPETQEKFDSALANLQSKLPTEQMKDQANQLTDLMDESNNMINSANQEVKFGRISWMSQYGGPTTDALDFTDVMDDVSKLRRILQIILWCEFFYGILLILRPKLTI